MKYKVGDKVKIKTWKDMQEKYGLNSIKNINCREIWIFTRGMEEYLNKSNTKRILTIEKIDDDYYSITGSNHTWSDEMIECLASEYKEPEPILTRFEILDL